MNERSNYILNDNLLTEFDIIQLLLQTFKTLMDSA